MKRIFFILLMLPVVTFAQFHVSIGAGHDNKDLFSGGYSAAYQFNNHLDIGADFRTLSTAADLKNGGLLTNDYNGVRIGYSIGSKIQLTPYAGYYYSFVEQSGYFGYSLKLENHTQKVCSFFIEANKIKTTSFNIGVDLRSIR